MDCQPHSPYMPPYPLPPSVCPSVLASAAEGPDAFCPACFAHPASAPTSARSEGKGMPRRPDPMQRFVTALWKHKRLQLGLA